MAGLTEAEYRALVEHSPVLVWRAGLDAGCDYFNETWLAFTGRTLEQELGDGWTAGVHPDDFERCLETYQRSFHARRPFEMEYRLRRHDGVYRYLFDRGVPFHDEAGAFAGFIGSCVDVHERVELDVSKARFLAMAAHELRTPLAGLRAQAQIAATASSPEELAQSLALVMSGVDRASHLLDQLLDLARMESAASEAERHRKSVDVTHMFETVLADLGALVHRRQLRIESEFQEPRIVAMELGMLLLLRNLLGNAFRYTPDGGRVVISTQREGAEIALTIDDSGPGIPADSRERVFERFERLGARGGDGVGLGMSIVQSVVVAHHAIIRLLESPLGGLRVQVRFPATDT